MTQKIYRSIKGKVVDIGSLRLQNETVRAVGNMGVNARGDRIDAKGNVIDPVGQQAQRRIQRQTNVSDTPVTSSQKPPAKADAITPTMPTNLADPVETFDDSLFDDIDEVAEEPVAVVETTTPEESAQTTGGLAGAIARAKSVKQNLDK